MSEWWLWLDFERGQKDAAMGEEYDPYETVAWRAGWDAYCRDHEDDPDESDVFLAFV